MRNTEAGYGIGEGGNQVTLTISYRVVPFAEAAYSTLSELLSPEILEELKDSLFDAELVLEVDNKKKTICSDRLSKRGLGTELSP